MGVSERQFEVLKAVHKFQLELLTKVLGHDVPVPGRIERLLTSSLQDVTPAAAQILRDWLDVLDLAITPLMIRDALKDHGSWDVAEALLCHHAWKRSASGTDRDKTDFIVTYLYRHPRTPGEWEIRGGPSEDGPIPTPQFQVVLRQMVGDDGQLPLPEEHRQLALEFEFFRNDVEDFRHFDQMMDSGIMNRVREVKEALGRSFYHPHVLAIIASYNSIFGQKFDQLFHSATRSIKSFAEKVQEQGGSIMSRVDGDVIVKQLADVEETKILETEYQRAQVHFHRVSRFKKAVDSRRGRAVNAATPRQSEVTQFTPPAPSTDASASVAPPPPVHVAVGIEESKVQAMEETIAHFIRAAGKKNPVSLVPLRHGNLGLLPADSEAYRVEYIHEKSFRADCARLHIRIVALIGRMADELNDYRGKQSSAYLWKPHADSLAYLLKASQTTLEQGQELVVIAQQRGLHEKVKGINGSAQRLREQIQVVAKALQSIGAAGI